MEFPSSVRQTIAQVPSKVDVCRLQILDDKFGVCLFDYCRRWFVDTTAQGAASVVRSMVKFASTLKSSGLSSASFTFPLPPECHYAAERLRMVVHSAGGVTGALFFAAAPLITEQDAVLESHAQILLENVVLQFTTTQLPVLEAIAAEHLIKAKDGGREDEVMHHFSAFSATAEAALAPHLPRRVTRRQVAIQSTLRARSGPQSLADASAAAASAANITVRHSRQAKTAVNILNTPGRQRYGGGAAQESTGGSAERAQKSRQPTQPKTPGHSRSVSMFQSPSTRGASSSPLAGARGGRRGGPVDLATAASLASAAEGHIAEDSDDKEGRTPDSKSSAPATPPDLPVASVHLPSGASSAAKLRQASASAQSQLAAWAESSDSDNESFSAAAAAASQRAGDGTPMSPTPQGTQSKTVSFVE